MNNDDFHYARTLAEILRIQRWAGGESVSAARIFGLMCGFESMICQEKESFGITEDTQEKVEDMLDDVESGTQSTDGPAIKDRLRRDGIKKTIAGRVMKLCQLQSRFKEGIDMIVQGQGSIFSGLRRSRLPEQDWIGALHYMELVDCTEDVRKKMHSVFAPAIPRIGEIVEPQSGSPMQVVAIEHVVVMQGDHKEVSQTCLVPHIFLEAIDDTDE